jgi:four helix bundle protein
MKHETYHENLKKKIDKFVHLAYKISRSFPREELFGLTSQLRRSALSVMLNYIEGYARNKDKVHKNFLEISYGSLKESIYILHFSMEENYIANK